MSTTQVCSTAGCTNPAMFRTRTKPTWCARHVAEFYEQAHAEMLEPFTRPTDFVLTRCKDCGFEGHNRFENVQHAARSQMPCCHACLLRLEAENKRKYYGQIECDVDKARTVAENAGYEYLGPLTSPSLYGDPHAVKCVRCENITAQQLDGDNQWLPCLCRKSGKTATVGTKKGTGENLLKNSDLDVKDWFDREKNGEELWNTAKKGSRKVVWWVCPEGHSFEERIDHVVKNYSRCPQCYIFAEQERARREAAFEAKYSSLTIAEVPELAEAWDEPELDPWTVPVLGDRRRYHFRCPEGHKRHDWPEMFLKRQCPACRSNETRKKNLAKAKADPFSTRLKPEIASQWHPTKNDGLSMATISPNSKREVWWLDPVCKHEFKDTVRDRDKYDRYRCPECDTILDSLAYHYPEIAEEWSDKNRLSPWQIRPTTALLPETPWWECPNDPAHSWRAMPSSRVNGSTCPQCQTVGKSAVEQRYAQAAKSLWGNAASGTRVKSNAFVRRASWSVDVLVGLPDGRTLGIEYDGSYWHKDKTELDTVKSHDLLRHGLVLCRIREHPLPVLGIDDPNYVELVAYAGSNDPERELEGLKQRLETSSSTR